MTELSIPAKTAENFRLTVLNPGGRDPQQQFHRVPAPGEGGHAPTNFHAFAACTLGAFHCNARSAIAEDTPVFLLLRSDFRASERAFADLKKQGRAVTVSLKETGSHQIAQQLRDPRKLARFMKIVSEADGCIATSPEAAEIYQRVRTTRNPSTSQLPIRLRTNAGTFLCPYRNNLEFSSEHANGTCRRGIIWQRS